MSDSITLNDGSSMPVLAFGSGTALFGKSAEDQVFQALETGFLHLDCASMYGNEDSVGRGLRRYLESSGRQRSDIYVTTKAGGDDVRKSLEESLKKLGLDYVDLYLSHSPLLTPARTQWPVMELLKKEGLARSVGVSNHRISDLRVIEEVGTIAPSINQIELHPYVMTAVEPLLAKMAEVDIKAAAYGPLSSAFRFPGGPVDEPVAKAAARLGVSENQILLRWALQRGGGEVVTTSSKVDRLKEALAIGTFELTAQEVEEIETAGKKKHQRVFMKHMDNEG